MVRVRDKVASRRRRKKYIKLAKGYWGARNKLYRTAREAVNRALVYSYRDRKKRKGDFRRLWITRINALCRQEGLSYSQFINGLQKANVPINRKMLSELAVSDLPAFKQLVDLARTNLQG